MPLHAATRHEPAARDQVAPDHAFLREHLDLLESADDHVFGVLLAELLDYLPAHFGVEEKPGGLFDTIVHEAPRLTATVERLRVQHGEIRAEVQRLREVLARERTTPSLELRERVAALSDVLREHEATEGLLLTDAVFAVMEERS